MSARVEERSHNPVDYAKSVKPALDKVEQELGSRTPDAVKRAHEAVDPETGSEDAVRAAFPMLLTTKELRDVGGAWPKMEHPDGGWNYNPPFQQDVEVTEVDNSGQPVVRRGWDTHGF